jgi:tetratricopeptide (TPR) repeat protein
MYNSMNVDSKDFKNKINVEINSLPEEIPQSLHQISLGNYQLAFTILNYCIQQGYGAGTPYCLQGYCLCQTGNEVEAINLCVKGKAVGINVLGSWYYYDVMVRALNNINDLERASKSVNEAINFFIENNSPGDQSDHLARKANILKQMAATLSRDLTKQSVAKEYIINAIQAICESISIFKEGWEELGEEIQAIGRIAGRVGVRSTDLPFLYQFSNISFLIEKYYTSKVLNQNIISENYNLAVDKFNEGNKIEAARLFEIAFSYCPENSAEDRAWKAIVAYRYGVCLWKLHHIEALSNLKNTSIEIQSAIEKIRSLWGYTLDVYKSLDKIFIKDFDQRLPLSTSVRNIVEDRLMQ